jgi:hypothetical protein
MVGSLIHENQNLEKFPFRFFQFKAFGYLGNAGAGQIPGAVDHQLKEIGGRKSGEFCKTPVGIGGRGPFFIKEHVMQKNAVIQIVENRWPFHDGLPCKSGWQYGKRKIFHDAILAAARPHHNLFIYKMYSQEYINCF